MTDLVVGTMTYVAPELISDTGDLQIESDMWAIGVIMYAMLAGRHPFDEPNQNALFQKIMSCDYVFEPENIWSSISKDCVDLIEKLLEPNVANRLTPS